MKKLLLALGVSLGIALAPLGAVAQTSKSTIQAEIAASSAAGLPGGVILQNITASYVDWLTCTGSGGTVYWNSGVPTCLPIGSSGQVLSVSGGLPSWGAPAAAAAGSLTGATLASGVVNSSLTSFGVLPQFQFGTGSSQVIAGTSANTGFGNFLQANNSGTVSNGGTVAAVAAALSSGSAAFIEMTVTGGASPTATIQTGSGITGGLTISAGAGNVVVAGWAITNFSILNSAGPYGGFSLASDGVIELRNNAGTDFGRLQFGGTSASFPAIKRQSASIVFRLADDSAYADTYAGNIYGNTISLGGSAAPKSQIESLTDGNLTVANSANSTFGLLQLGGASASFPAIKRNGTSLEVKLADDSAYAGLNVGSLSFQTAGTNLASASDGVLALYNSAQTGFGRLQFGGTSASFPAIKRNAAALNFRLADDSADAAITASSIGSTQANAAVINFLAAYNVQLGPADSATPIGTNTVSFQNGLGTNITAGGVAINASLSTGNATNPDIVFYTGVKGASGTALGTRAPALTIKGETQAAVFANAVTVGNGWPLNFAGGATITAPDPTNLQVSGSLFTTVAAFVLRSKTTITNGAGSSAGTLTNAPAVGNPTKWLPYDDNGVTRYIPAW